jgi:nitrogen-specific signal transduction histidine kinase
VNGPTRLVTDAHGRIVEAGGKAGELLGIDDRWLLGKPLAAFIPEASRRNFRTLLLDLSHGGGSTGLTLELRRRDGQQVTVEVEAVAEARGERLEWLLAHPEVAEQAEPQPAKPLPGAAPLSRLLSRLPVGIVSLDASLEVEYLNPAGRVYLGSGAVGKMLPDPWPGFSLRKYARRLYTSTPPPRALVETSTGRLLEVDGIPGGSHTSALLVLQDVTARERQRRAEHEFVSNAAHELRTPIAAIGSAVEVLEGGAKDTPADRDLFLSHIKRESDRLVRLADALLLLARIQTRQETPSLELVQVGPLLEEIARQLEPANGVGVTISCGAGVAMLADRDLLWQAIWNVAANAARYTSEGKITLLGRDLGRVSEVEVRDTGPGIPEAELERIFDRFFRGNREASGFGLGLPITREIARALSGTVYIESTLSAGTRIRIVLPSARLVEA